MSTRRSRRRARRSTGRGARCRRASAAGCSGSSANASLERIDEVARLETLHNGKPIIESRHVEMPMAVECLQYYAGWADKVHGETMPVKAQRASSTRCASRSASSPRSCRGTSRCCWRCGRSRRRWPTGNTVILKPASQTPLTALALGEIATRGRAAARRAERHHRQRRRPSGQAIVEHPGIDKVAFTGDTSTGKGIMRSAADTLKHLTLELGGKSPNIVFPDADLDAAVRGATVGIFYGKGEVCAAGSRLLVDESIKDAFIDEGRGADEEDGRRRSARSEDAPRRGVVEGQLERVLQLRRDREARGRVARRRRQPHRHRHRQGLLHAADRVRRRHARR